MQPLGTKKSRTVKSSNFSEDNEWANKQHRPTTKKRGRTEGRRDMQRQVAEYYS